MRIAVIHSFYDRRSPSGENSVVGDQVTQLRIAGHEVKLIAKYSDELSTTPLYAVKAAFNAATQRGADPSEQLAEFQPDIVHCHNLFPNWGSEWLDTWASRTVATVHNYRSVCAAATLHRMGTDCQLCPQQGSWNAVKHKCYRDSTLASLPLAWASRRSGSSQRLLNEARHLVFLNADAATTFIDLSRRQSHSVVPNFVRQPILTDTDKSADRIWLFAGRLTREKGILTLLKNWPRQHKLKIIGDGPVREQVQASAQHEPQTFSYRSSIPRCELERELDAAFALAVPSLWREGLPTIVLEALASQTPVLLSHSCSATADLIAKGGVRGFHAESIKSLLAAIAGIIDDHELISKQAAITYEEYYSPKAWTAQMGPIYQFVVDGADA